MFLLPFGNRVLLALQLLPKVMFDLLALVRHHLNLGQWDRCVVCAFEKRKHLQVDESRAVAFLKKRTSTNWEQKGRCENMNRCLTKRGRRWTLAFCCIYYTIYSTININRPRANWKRKLYGHKMIYIRVKYTMQHGQTVKKEKTPASQFGKWANETWTDTRKWLELSVRRLSWGQFLTLNSTVRWLLLFTCYPRKTLNIWTTLDLLKWTNPWCSR